MRVELGEFEFSELWEQVFYKKLSQYPSITDWEMRCLAEFAQYEAAHGRGVTLCAPEKEIEEAARQALQTPERFLSAPRPEKITECTACHQQGCLTRFVCHTSSPEDAASILRGGSLLSAVNARGLPDTVLMAQERNAAGDPADFFHYIMFSWGNCQAGDRLVMERKLGAMPTEEDLSIGFTPGVRFYFRYETLDALPNAVHDGFLPIKVQDELPLEPYLYALVIPEGEREELEACVPEALRGRTYYIKNDCRDIWDWSDKVYRFIETLDAKSKL